MMTDSNHNDLASSFMTELLKEKRTERRWKNFRFIVWVLIIALIVANMSGVFSKSDSGALTGKYVSLIRIDGMIAPNRDYSAEELIPILSKAFKDKQAEGLVIDINSPGGTPVQAAIIHDAILRLKQKFNKRVVIVGEDLLTSGAYYIAVAGDKIYVNPNTITGSIGVIMKGFGFVELMKKIGVERRVYTAGNDKDRLDPFLPQTESDMKKVQEVINEIHQNFVNAVMLGRKGKLKGDTSVLFTGDFWSGESAYKLGLVDGLGNLTDVMEREFHTTRYKEYSTSFSFFKMFGTKMSSAFDAMYYF